MYKRAPQLAAVIRFAQSPLDDVMVILYCVTVALPLRQLQQKLPAWQTLAAALPAALLEAAPTGPPCAAPMAPLSDLDCIRRAAAALQAQVRVEVCPNRTIFSHPPLSLACLNLEGLHDNAEMMLMTYSQRLVWKAPAFGPMSAFFEGLLSACWWY